MAFGSVEQGQNSNKVNLSRLRKKTFFKKKITKYKLDKDAVNLEKPSNKVVASNRAENRSYLKRKRIAGFVLVLLVVAAVSWVIYLMN